MRGGKVPVGESPPHQTVLIAWAGVDLPSFPGKIPVVDRGKFVNAMDPCADRTAVYLLN